MPRCSLRDAGLKRIVDDLGGGHAQQKDCLAVKRCLHMLGKGGRCK